MMIGLGEGRKMTKKIASRFEAAPKQMR